MVEKLFLIPRFKPGLDYDSDIIGQEALMLNDYISIQVINHFNKYYDAVSTSDLVKILGQSRIPYQNGSKPLSQSYIIPLSENLESRIILLSLNQKNIVAFENVINYVNPKKIMMYGLAFENDSTKFIYTQKEVDEKEINVQKVFQPTRLRNVEFYYLNNSVLNPQKIDKKKNGSRFDDREEYLDSYYHHYHNDDEFDEVADEKNMLFHTEINKVLLHMQSSFT